MPQQSHTALLALLLKAYNRQVMDFYYFPEVVMIGKQRIEPEEFYALLSEGYLQQTHRDSFGRFYTLSEKAKAFLHQSLHGNRIRHRRKQAQVQGSLQFS